MFNMLNRRVPFRSPISSALCVSTAVIGFATVAPGGVDSSITLTKVIEVGDSAPEFDSPIVVGALSAPIPFGGPLTAPPRIDSDGNLSFATLVTGSEDLPAPFTQAIYRFIDGRFDRILVEGDAAPGTGGSFAGFPDFVPTSPHIADGFVTFAATTDTALGGQQGLWTDRSGAIEQLLDDDDHLPGMPKDAMVFQFGFSTAGQTIYANVRYNSTPSVPSENEGLWLNADGEWENILINNLPAPGLPAGVIFDGDPNSAFGTVFGWSFNQTGTVIAQAWLSGPGVNSSNDEALWLFTPEGGLELLVRENTSAADAGDGFNFGMEPVFPTFGTDGDNIPPRLNDDGDALFGAIIEDAQLLEYTSIWTNRNGDLELLAKGAIPIVGFGEGDPAPGFPEGFKFQIFQEGFINDADVIAFRGFANPTINPFSTFEGIWWDLPGDLTLVVRENGNVPGMPGAFFTDLDLIDFNDDGTMLFTGVFAGPGIDFTNDLALFRANPDESIDMLLRAGDPVAIDTGGEIEERIMSPQFTISQGQSDDGRRVFEVIFEDDTNGIYTAQVISGVNPTLGDLDDDGDVDFADLLELLAAWGACNGSCPADLDDSGSVGFADLLILLSNWS